MKIETAALMAVNEIPGCLQADPTGSGIDLYFESADGQPNVDAAAHWAHDFGGHVLMGTSNRVTVIFPEGKAKNPHKRVQISLKLERDVDSDIIAYLERVENKQGLIKKLLRESMSARTMDAIRNLAKTQLSSVDGSSVGGPDNAKEK